MHVKQVSKFLLRKTRQACLRLWKRLDLRGRVERHQREIRLRLFYGAVTTLGGWGATIVITWLMTHY